MSKSKQIVTYDWFVGRESGKPCLVAGTASSIINFPYSDFRGIYVTCGDGPLRMSNLFKADYWVNANDVFPVPEKHLDIINSYSDTVFVFADSVTYSTRKINLKFLRDSLNVSWFAYDQRHFNQQPCKDKYRYCCDLLEVYPGRITLQEYVQKKFNRLNHYSTASSVAIHALAFAILLGCTPIFLQGIEIPRYRDDYKYLSNPQLDNLAYYAEYGKWVTMGRRFGGNLLRKIGLKERNSAFAADLPQILSDFSYLIDLAHDNQIQIYNLSKTSTLNEIEELELIEPQSASKMVG